MPLIHERNRWLKKMERIGKRIRRRPALAAHVEAIHWRLREIRREQNRHLSRQDAG
jgi:hypothetical protein